MDSHEPSSKADSGSYKHQKVIMMYIAISDALTLSEYLDQYPKTN